MAAILLLGCAEPSNLPNGNHDALRYMLPDGYASILEESDRFELLSLDPLAKGADRFHGYLVLGHAVLENRSDRTEVVRAIYEGVLEGGAVGQCFEPRHGLRAERQGRTVELVICHHCTRMRVYGPGMESPPWAPQRNYRTVPISLATKPMMDGILRRASIALAEPP